MNIGNSTIGQAEPIVNGKKLTRYPMVFALISLSAFFSDAVPSSIKFMHEDFSSEWPRNVGHNDDHYSFNIRIVDEEPLDNVVGFSIASRAGADSAILKAERAPDSSFRARVYLEGSMNKGVLKVGWLDTVICRYGNLSDTVFISHSLGTRRRDVGKTADTAPALYDAKGRRICD